MWSGELDSSGFLQSYSMVHTDIYHLLNLILYLLQEQHNDLLSLLAQEEVELGVFREALGLSAGSAAVRTALLEAQRASVERYGTYVNLREDDVDVSGDQALQAEAADGELSRVDVELEESTDSHSPDSFLGGGGSHTPW